MEKQSIHNYWGVLMLLSLIFMLSPVWGFSGEKDGFLQDIGICTAYAEAEMLAENGYAYVEESVGRFLVPLKGEEE
ncbi:MAG: hypothetical protein AB7D05_11215, partial [Mangrovibacterium sp.]